MSKSDNSKIHFNDIDLDAILFSFLNILNGDSFLFSSVDINSLQSAIDLLGIESFSEEIQCPTTFQDAFHFLCQPIFIDLIKKQFELSCELVAKSSLM
jgi:hypothetical protein